MSSEKKRWVILIAVSLLAAVGVGVLIYLQEQKIQEDRTQVENLKNQIAEQRAIIKQTPELVKEVIVQRETDTVIKEILSDDEDITNFVRTLHAFEEEAGVTITSLKEQRSARNARNRQDFDRVGYTLAYEADAFQLLSFLDLVESHPRFMSVTALKVQAASRSDYDSEDGPQHRVTLDLETYVYRPSQAAKEVNIDHYDRKRDLLISEISKRGAELRVASYDYRGARGRRDPFIDPRVEIEEGWDPLPVEEQIAIVDELIELTDALEELHEKKRVAAADGDVITVMKANAAFDEKLVEVEARILEVETNQWISFAPAMRRFEKMVLERVDEIMSDEPGGTTGPTLATLQSTFDEMERLIDTQEYELSLETFRVVEPGLGLAERDPLKQSVVTDLRELKLLADTVLEFESINLDIRGVALYESERPVALINGLPVTEGELVGDELIVRDIGTDQIEFAFRGLVLARVFGNEAHTN